MEKITGLGGVFFRAKDPKALGEWYEKNFGITAMSESAAEVWTQEKGPTVFAPFSANTTYYPASQQCMFNFRVNNMDAMLSQLEANGVKIEEEKMNDEIGKFAWVWDLEGNKIELWEPAPGSK
ncbi:MAG: VOC family protein [Candidatus Gracilibacteria bacterium]